TARQKFLDEKLGSERRELAREALHVKTLQAARSEQLEFLAQRRQTSRRVLRREKFARMRLEGQRAALQAAAPRFGADLLDHGLVPKMHAVEVADRQRDRGKFGAWCAVRQQHSRMEARCKVLNYSGIVRDRDERAAGRDVRGALAA